MQSRSLVFFVVKTRPLSRSVVANWGADGTNRLRQQQTP
jgi:hypothetical protein